MKHELAVAALWAIAILVTVLTVKPAGDLTLLLPVYAICMIGSIITVRIARSSSRHA